MSELTRTKPRIFADFINVDDERRLRLNCNGTWEDLRATGVQLTEGLEIVVYSEDVEADARVTYSADEGLWVAQIDWDKIRTDDQYGSG